MRPGVRNVYFDERGVSRRYETSLEDGEWRWWRDAAEFSQRFISAISDDGNTIVSTGEMSRESPAWEPDLELTYTRA
jgi:hypothetical protein